MQDQPSETFAAQPEPNQPPASPPAPAINDAAIQALQSLRQQLDRIVLGQGHVIDQVLIGLVAGGHVLLEGAPGTAKTLLVRALAALIGGRTKRIQFTPDLMPADIIGANTFNLQSRAFELHQGPIFTDLLLADEINRAPAKTQSALLEAMSERHATIDGKRHELSPVFMVLATQNPVEFEGTYPLPEAQQDRFLLKAQVPYPNQDAERAILRGFNQGTPPESLLPDTPLMSLAQVQALRESLPQVRIEDAVTDYILQIVRLTRTHQDIELGAGPRGTIDLLKAAKAHALLKGRSYVTPDDVVAMVQPTLAHRLTLTAEAEVSGLVVTDVLQQLLDQTDVPR